ncbi:hypothetical protein PVAP13_5KG233707 [Panicum virgatum]|uniref:Uncharacterized protein n=1 Tax=Panicum virgatum TaxID=38727 RepID=A0A8T0SL13_PANVG|nr:hypothetical protein PVAP13_5KG233707 [Panicum virgatum]
MVTKFDKAQNDNKRHVRSTPFLSCGTSSDSANIRPSNSSTIAPSIFLLGSTAIRFSRTALRRIYFTSATWPPLPLKPVMQASFRAALTTKCTAHLHRF